MPRYRRARQSLLLGVSVSLVMTSVALAGEAPPGVRFEAGARFGVAFPTGGEFDDDYDYLLHRAYPIGVDLGVRLSELIFIGTYFSYAPTIAYEPFPSRVDLCPPGCSIQVYRFGLQLQVHPADGRWGLFDPWVGVGGGYEIQHQTRSFEHVGWVSGSIRGPEYINFQIGLGFVLGKGFTLGPYFSASLAEYQVAYDVPVPNPELHWWLTVGIRLSITP
jgi:hypothetical protein